MANEDIRPFPGCDFAGRALQRNRVMNFARYKRQSGRTARLVLAATLIL
jgi:hypothetical protein